MDFYKKIIPNAMLRNKILGLLSFVPDKSMIKIQYRIKMGGKLNLKNPKRWSEKVQWYKLNYKNPLLPKCVDKYEVREYVKDQGLEHILNECYGVFDSMEEVDFDSLPDRFVMKDTLGGGGKRIIRCSDKKELKIEETKALLSTWARRKKWKSAGREWAYDQAGKHRIIVEKLIEDKNSEDKSISDYKFLCFNGEPEYIFYDTARFIDHKRNIYDKEWNNLNVISDYRCLDEEVEKPEKLEEMLNVARILSKPFPMVRVDLYCIDGEIIFGELTFYPLCGYVKFNPDSFDFEMGEKFILPDKN